MAREDLIEDGSGDELVETTRPKPKNAAEIIEDGDTGERKPLRDPGNEPDRDATDEAGETATEFVELDDDDLKAIEGDRRRSSEEETLSPDDRRERRRQEKRERRDRQRSAEQRNRRRIGELENTIAQLSEQIQQVTGANRGATLQQVDERLSITNRAFAAANAELEDAVEKNDGKRVLKALADRDAARDAFNKLSIAKGRLARQAEEPDATRRRPESVDPEVQKRASRFAKAVDLDNLTQDEQRDLYRLDAAVRAEGFNERTDDYWKELAKRAKRRGFDVELDDDDEDDVQDVRRTRRERSRVDEDDDDVRSSEARRERADAPRRPPTGTHSGDATAGGRKGVYLPKEFIDSCKAAGVWEDPVKRREMIQRYRVSAKKYGVDRAA